MAFERDPDRNDDLRRQALDNELRADPELDEGAASGGRMALFVIAVIAILGVVFYGLNNSSSGPDTAQNPPATTTNSPAQQSAQGGKQGNTMSPDSPNANPGQTTGSAPAPRSGATSSDANNPAGTVTNSPASSQTGVDSK